MTLLFVYVGVALGFSFLCSILEAVLLSVSPSYIASIVDERPKVAAVMRELKADVDRPLAAVLSLNTVAHTIGAAGAGAEAQRLWGSDVLAIASAVLTLLILVVSEIVPKTLGAVYWRRLLPFAARVLPPLIRVLLPLVKLSEIITRLLRRQDDERAQVSKEEVAALARLGEEQGVLAAAEGRVLRGLFKLGELRARDIMTPRTVLYSLQSDITVGEAVAEKESMVYSRVPVYDESPDAVVGYVLKDELLLRAARDELTLPVGELVRDLIVVPDSLLVLVLFDRLLERGEHIALVVDEYGGVDGVVTMEDVLETLLGLEIVDEADADQDLREVARRKWKERAKRSGSRPPPGLLRDEVVGVPIVADVDRDGDVDLT